MKYRLTIDIDFFGDDSRELFSDDLQKTELLDYCEEVISENFGETEDVKIYISNREFFND